MKKWILSIMVVVVLSVGGCNYLWSSGGNDPNNVVAITNYADQLNAQATVYKNAIDATTAYLAAGGVLDANGVAKYLHLKEELERIQVAVTAVAASIRSGDYSVGTPRIITGLEIAKQTNDVIPGPWQLPIAGLLTLITGFATWYAKSKAAEAAEKEAEAAQKTAEAKLATSALQNVVTVVEKASDATQAEVKEALSPVNTKEEKALITSLKSDVPDGYELTKIEATETKL
jgi:hypothetical protein